MRLPMTKAGTIVVLVLPFAFPPSGTFALWSDEDAVPGVTIPVSESYGGGDDGGD